MEGGKAQKSAQENPFARMGGDMEAIVGIICEYDPFHGDTGRQYELIREQLPRRAHRVSDERAVHAAGNARFARARRARPRRAGGRCGPGAGIALRLLRARRRAFCAGRRKSPHPLGFVTHLSFGAEDGLDALLPAASLLDAPTPAFQAALRAALDRGASFAAAQGEALAACLPASPPAPWEKPNNILALCYLRALRRLESPLVPLPVLREGDYHAPSLEGQRWPSATAVRAAFLGGNLAAGPRGLRL